MAEATKAFFVYISLTDLEQSGLCFMGVHVREDTATVTSADLLRLQGVLFNSWLNHVKAHADLETLLRDIPSQLWQPALARTQRHMPGYITISRGRVR